MVVVFGLTFNTQINNGGGLWTDTSQKCRK